MQELSMQYANQRIPDPVVVKFWAVSVEMKASEGMEVT
jgi:hypothetical protein